MFLIDWSSKYYDFIVEYICVLENYDTKKGRNMIYRIITNYWKKDSIQYLKPCFINIYKKKQTTQNIF